MEERELTLEGKGEYWPLFDEASSLDAALAEMLAGSQGDATEAGRVADRAQALGASFGLPDARLLRLRIACFLSECEERPACLAPYADVLVSPGDGASLDDDARLVRLARDDAPTGAESSPGPILARDLQPRSGDSTRERPHAA